MKKVVVVGSLNLDLVASVPRMPALGETLTGQDFATYPGGKGANQAVAAARLGGETVMIGRLGDGAFGQRLHAALADEDIATHCVEKIAGASGSAIIMVTPEGYNSIVVMPGANYGLKPEDLEIYREEFKGAAVVLAQLEIPLETVIRPATTTAQMAVPLVLVPT